MFLLAPELFALLRDFLYMGDLFNCLKRKIRTSNSDSETKSPERKRVYNKVTTIDNYQEDANTDNRSDDVHACFCSCLFFFFPWWVGRESSRYTCNSDRDSHCYFERNLLKVPGSHFMDIVVSVNTP